MIVLAAALVLAEPAQPVVEPRMRLESGLMFGSDLYARGSFNQSQYAPQMHVRLGFGIPQIGLLARFGGGVPVDPRKTIADRSGGVLVQQALGLRSMPIQRRWLRFGLWLLARYDRFDRRTALDLQISAQTERYEQRTRVHQLSPELGFEWALPLPIARLRAHGFSLAITFTHSLGVVFPLASKRTLIDPDGTTTVTHYRPVELGTVGRAGGVTVDVQLGLTLAWDPLTRRPADR